MRNAKKKKQQRLKLRRKLRLGLLVRLRRYLILVQMIQVVGQYQFFLHMIDFLIIRQYDFKNVFFMNYRTRADEMSSKKGSRKDDPSGNFDFLLTYFIYNSSKYINKLQSVFLYV